MAITTRQAISLAFGIGAAFVIVAVVTAFVQVPSMHFWLTALLLWWI